VHAALDTADVRLIDFDEAAQALTARTHHRDTKAVQHRPRGLIGAQSQRTLHTQG
jgi:hypothetical protein